MSADDGNTNEPGEQEGAPSLRPTVLHLPAPQPPPLRPPALRPTAASATAGSSTPRPAAQQQPCGLEEFDFLLADLTLLSSSGSATSSRQQSRISGIGEEEMQPQPSCSGTGATASQQQPTGAGYRKRKISPPQRSASQSSDSPPQSSDSPQPSTSATRRKSRRVRSLQRLNFQINQLLDEAILLSDSIDVLITEEMVDEDEEIIMMDMVDDDNQGFLGVSNGEVRGMNEELLQAAFEFVDRNSRATAPAGRNSRATTPAGRNGRATTPAGRNSRATTPAGRNSRATTPAGRNSRATAPAGRNSRATAPAGRNSRAPAPAGPRVPQRIYAPFLHAPRAVGANGILLPAFSSREGSNRRPLIIREHEGVEYVSPVVLRRRRDSDTSDDSE